MHFRIESIDNDIGFPSKIFSSLEGHYSLASMNILISTATGKAVAVSPNAPSHPKYRPDIDGLRAVAVLSVVAYHAFPDWLKGGFVGVDIFFVISGYLISAIIFENIDRGTFSFLEFYSRRIRRIFPALTLVLAACLAFGWIASFPDEYTQLGKHVAGGAGFISNLVLLNEAGYFDNSAETKPLLHLWSLGIEEQFYIAWPLLLWISRKLKTGFIAATVTLIAVSFYLNISKVNQDTVSTFYSPQTRFWELLAGSLLAWFTIYMRGNRSVAEMTSIGIQRAPNISALSNAFSFLGIAFLLSGFWIISSALNFPGTVALVPVLGSVMVIAAGQNAFINRTVLSNPIFVWFGLISFPLYLWHWPLLSFARIVESKEPSLDIRFAAVAIAVVLAWLTYEVIEKRVRLGGHNRQKVLALLTTMSVIGFVGFATYREGGFTSRFPSVAAQDDGYAAVASSSMRNCERHFPEWRRTTDNPCLLQRDSGNSVAVIGDSHAGQLFPGLIKYLHPSEGIASFSASCAAPYIDTATAQQDLSVRRVRGGAYKLIDKAYDYIIDDPRIKVVLLAHNPVCSYADAIDMANPNNTDYRSVLREGMKRTFARLVKAGKKVIVVFDNPMIDFDPKLCAPRPFRLTNSDNHCSFPRQQHDANPAVSGYRSLVEEVLTDYPEVKTFNLSDLLCDKQICYISKNGMLFYADFDHLNKQGSEYVARYLVNFIQSVMAVGSPA
ncbi:acyltransferase family protein [Bradyrhizobium sp. USDA 4504]